METRNPGCGGYAAGALLGLAYAVGIYFAIERVVDVDDIIAILCLFAVPVFGIIVGIAAAAILCNATRKTRVIVLATPVLLIAASYLLPSVTDGPPDATLRAEFAAKRSVFSRVEAALAVKGRSPSPADLKSLGIQDVDRSPYAPYEVDLPVWSYGAGHLFAEEDEKGFVYCKSHLSDYHDDMFGCKNYDYDKYKSLGGNWYIYYSYEGP